MFEARLQQGSVIKKLVDAIKDLANEANWEVDEQGVSMQAMDASHVCLMAFHLEASKFDHYRCDAPHTFGVNLTNLGKILKCASNDDSVSMKLGTDDTMVFLFEGGGGGSACDFSLNLMHIDCERMEIPESMDSHAKAELPAADFGRIVRDLSTLGDNITISCARSSETDDRPLLKFSTCGEIGNANITLKGEGEASSSSSSSSISIVLEADTSQTFSARYLVSLSKGSTLSSSAKITMSKDAPMCIEFAIGNIGTLQYFLAPKFDDEAEAVVQGDDT